MSQSSWDYENNRPIHTQAEGKPLDFYDGIGARGNRILAANEQQVAGTHYGVLKYQHWDFATDASLHYLIGNASKYVTRWRGKGGTEDLRKCLHYLQKAREREVYAMVDGAYQALNKFTAQLPDLESRAVFAMCSGNYEEAEELVKRLMLQVV